MVGYLGNTITLPFSIPQKCLWDSLSFSHSRPPVQLISLGGICYVRFSWSPSVLLTPQHTSVYFLWGKTIQCRTPKSHFWQMPLFDVPDQHTNSDSGGRVVGSFAGILLPLPRPWTPGRSGSLLCTAITLQRTRCIVH